MSENIPALSFPLVDVEFNITSQEQFINEKGILFEHWAAIPSPIGLKDRGDYRRSDALDTMSSHGFIYKKVGEFNGILVNNTKRDRSGDGGIYDAANSRLVLPRNYTSTCRDKTDISLLQGDRIYAKTIELKVDNYQRAEYNPDGTDYLQFPAREVQILMDSKGIEYHCGKDFVISENGNIRWLTSHNPGIDVETGKGRVYSIRYSYVAFWYVLELINEIRVTNQGPTNTPARLPYQATLQREYVYHSINRPDDKNKNPKQESSRTNEAPVDRQLSDENYDVKVDVKLMKP